MKSLKRTFGSKVLLIAGPESPPPLAGLEPTVFVHAARFIDHEGRTEDGARIGRRAVRGPGRQRGFEQERPARIVVSVTTISATHRQVQELCEPVAPEVLFRLETMPDVLLGVRPSGGTLLSFEDFHACLHGTQYGRDDVDGIGYHWARLTFHLDGFLHVRISGNGTLRRSGGDVQPRRASVKVAAGKKSRTKKTSKKTSTKISKKKSRKKSKKKLQRRR